jgi:hypothetical protein
VRLLFTHLARSRNVKRCSGAGNFSNLTRRAISILIQKVIRAVNAQNIGNLAQTSTSTLLVAPIAKMTELLTKTIGKIYCTFGEDYCIVNAPYWRLRSGRAGDVIKGVTMRIFTDKGHGLVRNFYFRPP